MPVVNYDWDELEDNIVEEYDDAGNTLATYTTEPELHGNLISQNRGGVESQYHFDAQGSTLALTDANQQVTDTYAYTAFGERTERTGTTENPFQYIGQKQYRTDAVTGDIYVRRRPYRPTIGRWLSVDPIYVAIGISHHLSGALGSAYQYTSNRAVLLKDPSGLASLPPEREIVPPSSGILYNGGACWQSVGNFAIFADTGVIAPRWKPVFMLNVDVRGVPGGACGPSERSHRVDITVFESVGIGKLGGGLPPVNLTDDLARRFYESVDAVGTCEKDKPTLFEDPTVGRYVTFSFRCFTACKCGTCLPYNGLAFVTSDAKEIPTVTLNWKFVPKESDECEFGNCDVTVRIAQHIPA